MKEICYRGAYVIVSEDGRIFSKRKELVQKKDKYGYMRVRLQTPEKRLTVLVHRLVATAYIKNPNNLPCVNHKDENKANNKFDNLEWCSVDYNNKYNNRYERMKKNNKPVLQIKDGVVINEYGSISEASKAIKAAAPSNIGNCCHKRIKNAYGYQWQFRDNR